jgi:hypothetical protein
MIDATHRNMHNLSLSGQQPGEVGASWYDDNLEFRFGELIFENRNRKRPMKRLIATPEYAPAVQSGAPSGQ